MSKVQFHHIDQQSFIKDRKSLKFFISKIFEHELKNLKRIDYIFCSDPFLLKVNKKFLGHDYYTDIITFRLSEKNEPIIGEVYISTERVKENCILYKTTFKEELLRVIFHGALHLCGYKDKYQKDSAVMRSKENYYITLFVSNL